MRKVAFEMKRTKGGYDEGFALVVVLGAILIISIVAMGGYALSSQTLTQSTHYAAQNKAYQAASTGLEMEMPYFSPDHLDRYPKTVNLDTGDRYTVTVTDLGAGRYEIKSVGGSVASTEAVLTQFQYLNLWDMNISGGGSGIGARNGMNGNSWIVGSVYVSGDMELKNNTRLYGGPVFLKDGVYTGNGGVGSSGNPVDSYGAVPPGYSTPRGSVPDLNIPTLSDANMVAYLAMAQKTSNDTSRTGSAPPNADATYYTVLHGDTTISGNFGNKQIDAISVVGNTIYLKPNSVVYVDGTLTFGGNIQYYSGTGIIVAKNGFVIGGGLAPANGLSESIGVPGDTKTVPMMDNANVLGLLSQGDVTLNSGSWVNAAIFINGGINASASVHPNFRGSVICDWINFVSTNSVLATQPGMYKFLPSGMPELSGMVARTDWIRR